MSSADAVVAATVLILLPTLRGGTQRRSVMASALLPQAAELELLSGGTEQAITGLEIYNLGAGEDDLRLPIPESIHLFVPNQT
jgi:hypothetical protein